MSAVSNEVDLVDLDEVELLEEDAHLDECV
jgi:hypothetical protein